MEHGKKGEDNFRIGCERCGSEVIRKNQSQWMLKITDYAEKLLEGLAHDKKSDGNAVNAVFVNETGSFEIKKVTLADMKDILIGNQKLSSAGRFTQSECK